MNWARLEWQWRLFKRRFQELAKGGVPQGRSGGPARLKTCRVCRALIPRTARTCPECGAHLGWFAPAGRATRGGLFVESPATGVLLAGMAGLFLLTWIVSVLVGREGLGPSSGLGMLGTINGRVLFRFGAYHSAVFQTGDYWRLVTGVFLHGGLPHILFNAAALYNLGREVESVYGWARTVVFFVGAGAAGSVCSVLLNSPFLVGIGSSGAVFGLIGVVGVYGFRRGGSYGSAVMRTAAQWAVFSLIFGVIAGADNMAHLGGLIGGAALAFVVPPERERVSAAWNAAGLAVGALVPLAFAFVLRGGF